MLTFILRFRKHNITYKRKQLNPLYSFIKHNLRWYHSFYFKKVEVKGVEHVPERAGKLFVVNHQNTFMDAMLVGAPLNQDLLFLVRSDVFKGVFKLIFKAFNLIPIYRAQDGHKDGPAKNKRIFKKCIEVLRKQKSILIFPEGGSTPAHVLTPLKKGFGRIAMNYVDDYKKPSLYIIPVTINYEHHFQPGYRVWVEYHKPIKVDRVQQSVPKLVKQVQEELRSKLVHCEPEWNKIQQKFKASGSIEIGGGEVKSASQSYFKQYPIEGNPSKFLNVLFSPYLWLIKVLLSVVDDEDFFGSVIYVMGLILFLGQLFFWVALGIAHPLLLLPGLVFSLFFLKWIKTWKAIDFRM